MLQKIDELFGAKIAAADGEIGRVKDLYFDDQSHVIRYLVVDTGTWLSDRQVLLPPHVIDRWDRDQKSLAIRLTRKQIEDSPPIDAHRPVSRQSEQAFHRHYGWQAYWDGGGMWGIAGFPVVGTALRKNARPHHGHNQRDDLHLRSTHAVTRYGVYSSDGAVGILRSFMVDDKSWTIGELVVKTGHWYSGREILIRAEKIERISYDESRIYLDLTSAEIEQTANFSVVPIAPEL